MKNETLHLTVVLDQVAHQSAAKFAAQQTTPSKGRRVYLNTLAVYAVQRYLSCVCQLEIDLNQGDSWQPELHCIMDVADLVIPNVGKIECRPVLPNSTQMLFPPEAIENRVGYVAVQFREDLSSVDLLGFMPNADGESVEINQIQPLDDLLDLIYVTRISNIRELLLKEWKNGWEPIDSFVFTGSTKTTNQREFALRNIPTDKSYDSIQDFTAGKVINLKAQMANIPLLLLIGLKNEPDGRVNVKTRLHSAGEERTLPANLRLILQGDDGTCLSEVYYSEAMDFIQLKSFKVQHGTEFKLQVALDENSFTESFTA